MSRWRRITPRWPRRPPTPPSIPRNAAAAASERHDEIVGRLEQERRARDETESRRARLSEALLFETPGSRVDAFARASRTAIEARLRRFGFVEGDPDLAYRALVRDLAGRRGGTGIGLFLRSIWAYRGQGGLIALAIVAFALAFGIDRWRQPGVQEYVAGRSASLAPALDWSRAHDATLGLVAEGLVILGILALAVNLWRAAMFARLLFQGLRMLNLDLRERRRELDASAARLERRVAALQIEADAAQQRSETLARRAGATPGPNRQPGPGFLKAGDAPERAARAFLDELGRAMDAASTPAPQRLILAIDGLDALAPGEARRFLEVAVRVAARGVALVAAADLGRLGADAREAAESLFEVVYDVGSPTGADALAHRLLGAATPPAAEPAAPPVALGGALDETEVGFLKTASALIGPRPRALKRFYNAYRLARLGDAPRGALALALAALMAPDPSPAASLRAVLLGEGEAMEAPAALAPAFDDLGAPGIGKEGMRRALEAARDRRRGNRAPRRRAACAGSRRSPHRNRAGRAAGTFRPASARPCPGSGCAPRRRSCAARYSRCRTSRRFARAFSRRASAAPDPAIRRRSPRSSRCGRRPRNPRIAACR